MRGTMRKRGGLFSKRFSNATGGEKGRTGPREETRRKRGQGLGLFRLWGGRLRRSYNIGKGGQEQRTAK